MRPDEGLWKKFGQHANEEEAGDEAKKGSYEENAGRVRVAEADHGVLRDRLESDANKGEEIRDGDGAAFFLGLGALLDEGIDRDYEETAGNAEQGEVDQHGEVRDPGTREESGHNEDAAEAGENHPELDFFTGKQPGEEAPDADSEAECSEEIAGMLVVHAKDVRGVKDNVEQDERAEEPKEGVGDDSGPESGI